MKSPIIRRAALAAALPIVLAGPALAQSAENPQLVLTITAGWITGGRLWRLPRQEATAPNGALDTVGLERRFGTGLVVGLGATLFRSPHIGYSAELVFLGTSTESRCSPPSQWAPDSLHLNQQACTAVQGKTLRTSAVALQVGLTWRPVTTGKIEPYLRGVAGPGYLGGPFVETSGTVILPSDTSNPYRVLTLLGASSHRSITWVATLAAGVTFTITPGTQFRFEARDVVTNVPVATGPGNPLTVGTLAPVGGRVVHLASFTVGLDIVLEQSQRPHRY